MREVLDGVIGSELLDRSERPFGGQKSQYVHFKNGDNNLSLIVRGDRIEVSLSLEGEEFVKYLSMSSPTLIDDVREDISRFLEEDCHYVDDTYDECSAC